MMHRFLSDYLSKTRYEKRMSRNAFAAFLGISTSTLNSYLKRETTPGWTTLLQMAQRLEVPICALFPDEGHDLDRKKIVAIEGILRNDSTPQPEGS